MERGDTGSLSTVAGLHAVFLADENRLAEAEQAAAVSRETTAKDDIASQVLWRSARARIAAREGALEQALSLSEEALTLDAGADHAVVGSEVLKARAEALSFAGRGEEAAKCADAAVERLERKGSVVGAERARRLLAPVHEHA